MPRQLMPISTRWFQGAVLTYLIGFTVLIVLAYLVYRDQPPVPAKVSVGGRVLFTRDDVITGMNVFQRYGLMEYGSVYGHGAYLGPDFTAEYLHITAQSLIRRYQDLPGGCLSAQERVAAGLHENRYYGAEDTLQWSVARAGAHRTNGRLLSLRLFNQEPLSRRESGLDLQSRRHSQIGWVRSVKSVN